MVAGAIDSGVEGYGLETHIIISCDQSPNNAHTECGMPFDLIHVMHFALKITSMRYLCETVAIIPGNL